MTKTLKQFIAAHGITMAADWAANNPNMADTKWAESANHYKCVLARGRKRMTVYFSQGCGISRDPDAESVLDCIASDAAGLDNARSFEVWCAEYGYDTDSRAAEKTYKTIEKQVAQLREFIGDDVAFNDLLFDTERQ